MSSFQAYHLVSRPKDHITEETFQLRTHPIPRGDDLKDGQSLVRANYLSLDPAMRGWLNNARSYVPPVKIGEIMRGQALSTVVLSKDPQLKAGDQVLAFTGWAEYAILNNSVKGTYEKIMAPAGANERGNHTADSISAHLLYLDFIGILGITGLTAYFGLLDICRPEPGETLVVSGAAGAVGTVVGQIGLLKGCRVIGIAGGKEKCAYLKNELKFHEVIDYKTSDKEFQQALRKATPKYINIYFDNGGLLLRSN